MLSWNVTRWPGSPLALAAVCYTLNLDSYVASIAANITITCLVLISDHLSNGPMPD
jgi:hypothetical protein